MQIPEAFAKVPKPSEMGEKRDLSDFNCGMAVGARQASLLCFSINADRMRSSRIIASRDYFIIMVR